MSHPRAVLDYWFGPASTNWWHKDPLFDKELAQQWGALMELAQEGKLKAWEDSAEGALAVVILLDQMSRNCYRGEARAFAYDSEAQRVTLEA